MQENIEKNHSLHNELIIKSTDKDKFDFLKEQEQSELLELFIYINNNQTDEKIRENLNEAVVKAIIWQHLGTVDEKSLHQLHDKEWNETVTNHLWPFHLPADITTTDVDMITYPLVEKLKERSVGAVTLQQVLCFIVNENPQWFQQILDFLARCLSIHLGFATKYHTMKELKSEVKETIHEVKKSRRLKKHLTKRHVTHMKRSMKCWNKNSQ